MSAGSTWAQSLVSLRREKQCTCMALRRHSGCCSLLVVESYRLQRLPQAELHCAVADVTALNGHRCRSRPCPGAVGLASCPSLSLTHAAPCLPLEGLSFQTGLHVRQWKTHSKSRKFQARNVALGRLVAKRTLRSLYKLMSERSGSPGSRAARAEGR